MSKSVLFLVLALCVLARGYVISKDDHPVSCFEEDSPGARDADVLVSKPNF